MRGGCYYWCEGGYLGVGMVDVKGGCGVTILHVKEDDVRGGC